MSSSTLSDASNSWRSTLPVTLLQRERPATNSPRAARHPVRLRVPQGRVAASCPLSKSRSDWIHKIHGVHFALDDVKTFEKSILPDRRCSANGTAGCGLGRLDLSYSSRHIRGRVPHLKVPTLKTVSLGVCLLRAWAHNSRLPTAVPRHALALSSTTELYLTIARSGAITYALLTLRRSGGAPMDGRTWCDGVRQAARNYSIVPAASTPRHPPPKTNCKALQ